MGGTVTGRKIQGSNETRSVSAKPERSTAWLTLKMPREVRVYPLEISVILVPARTLYNGQVEPLVMVRSLGLVLELPIPRFVLHLRWKEWNKRHDWGLLESSDLGLRPFPPLQECNGPLYVGLHSGLDVLSQPNDRQIPPSGKE